MLALAATAIVAIAIAGPAKVVDGDGLVVDGVEIRLCGVDAPERREAGYLASTQSLAAIVKGRTVRCVPVGEGTPCDGRSKRWNHGRLVAQCFLDDGRDVAAEQVRAGHAIDCDRFSGGHYAPLQTSTRKSPRFCRAPNSR